MQVHTTPSCTQCKYTLRRPALWVIVEKKLCRAPGDNSEINIISMKKLVYRHCKATVFSGQIRFCETSMACAAAICVNPGVSLGGANETFFKICHSFSQRSWFLKGILPDCFVLEMPEVLNGIFLHKHYVPLLAASVWQLGLFLFWRNLQDVESATDQKACWNSVTSFAVHSWQFFWHSLLHCYLNQAVYLHFVYHLYLYCTFSDTRCYILDPWTCWSLWEVLLVCE